MLNIPLGSDEFREFREGNELYVDKSLLIKDLIDDGAKVLLMTRPRRFGKSLNMSMVKTFFEKTKEDHRPLFKALNIWKSEEKYKKELGKYPVIYMSLKGVGDKHWEGCLDGLKEKITEIFEFHSRIKIDLSENEVRKFEAIEKKTASQKQFEFSLGNLSHWLERYYKEKVIILIDEYDAPINRGYTEGYQEEIIHFMRVFLGEAMKSNPSLKKAILTGVTRIAGESLFSGLNNFISYSVLDDEYSEYFGFSEAETRWVLEVSHVRHDFSQIKKWYDGYTFGKQQDIYNPWSIMNVAKRPKALLESYWINSATDTILKDALAKSFPEVKETIYGMIKGKKERLPVVDNVTYDDLLNITDGLWSFLLYAGYLTAENLSNEARGRSAEFYMPNEEVKGAMKKMIASWLLDHSQNTSGVNVLLTAMLHGNQRIFEERLSYYVHSSFSYFDRTNTHPELVYHAFILGLLVHLEWQYYFNSNPEAGIGRADVLIMPKAGSLSKNAVILEFKKARKQEELEEKTEIALDQIQRNGYVDEAKKRGAEIIYCYGIGFFKEEMMMKMVIEK